MAMTLLIAMVTDTVSSNRNPRTVTNSAFDARNCQRPVPLVSALRSVPQPYSDPTTDEDRTIIRMMATPCVMLRPVVRLFGSKKFSRDPDSNRNATKLPHNTACGTIMVMTRSTQGMRRRLSLYHSHLVRSSTCEIINGPRWGRFALDENSAGQGSGHPRDEVQLFFVPTCRSLRSALAVAGYVEEVLLQ